MTRSTDGTETTPRAPGPISGVVAWLVSRPRGWWAGGHGRPVRVTVTVVLILAALGAWALALVQPWLRQRADAAVVPFPALRFDARRLCEPTDDLMDALAPPAAAAKAIRRDPFATAQAGPPPCWPAEAGVASCAVADRAGDPCGEAATTTLAVMERARGLRLDMTVETDAGGRWAVIDGRRYREGDEVAGMAILEIRTGRVTLRQSGVTCLLRVE